MPAEVSAPSKAWLVLAMNAFAFIVCFACWMMNAVLVTFLVRGALDLRLRMGLLSAALHPLWVAAATWIFARSTWVNGVLHRNEWRGRVRDARTLKT